MLPEINTTNPVFKVFHSSVVGSMQEAERKRQKKEPTRLKNIKETKNKDKYSSTLKDNSEEDQTAVKDTLSKQEKRKRQKQARHASVSYAASAYQKQDTLNKKMQEPKTQPIAEI